MTHSLPHDRSPAHPVDGQLDLQLSRTSRLDDRTLAILECVAGDPIHADDRAVLVAAIVAEAEANGGEIDLDRVRPNISTADGRLIVYPRLVGAVINVLAHADVIRFDHWKESGDVHGRNQSKMARVWRLVDREVA